MGNLNLSDSKIRAISSILNLCERATINMEREGISNAIKAIIIICMKFVDKEALFKSVLPDMFIDWDYVRAQGSLGPATATASATAAAAAAAASSSSSSSSSSSLPSSSNSNKHHALTSALGRLNKRNLLGDAQTWLHVMQFLDFGEPRIPDRILQKQYPPLYCMHSAILSTGTHGKLNFNDACKLLILNNIEGLTSKMMIELHTSARLNCNTHAICSGIVSALADERHGHEVYEETFQYVLGTLAKVDEAALAQHIAHYKQTAAARIKAWEMKAVQGKICRPSMRKVAAAMTTGGNNSGHANGDSNMSATTSTVAAMTVNPSSTAPSTTTTTTMVVGSALLAMDGAAVSAITFEQHCNMVRYPNSMSNLRRLRCYLLACQSHQSFDYRDYVEQLVPNDVARALSDNPVTIPDAASVHMAIESLAMNVRPFDEINQFRTRCFMSFASHQKRNLTLTQVLKLYIAAYQYRPIWKQVWTSVYPVISPQIIRDVETFVGSVPFAVLPFIQILKTSSPFGGGGGASLLLLPPHAASYSYSSSAASSSSYMF